MEGLLEALDDPELPLLQWTEVFANVGVSHVSVQACHVRL